MNCRKCNKPMPDAPFCPWCGTEQEPKPTPRKRANGEGCAFKRGRTWTAMWSDPMYIDEDGKKHRTRHTKGGFKTKSEALKFASNPQVEKVSPTLQAYYSSWKASDYLDLSESKRSAYRIAWDKLKPLAPRKMDSLTIEDLQNTIDKKASTYYPAKDMKQLLSHLFKRAVAEGNARTNLAEFIRLPPMNEKEMTPFAEDEIKLFWDAYGHGDTFIGFVLVMIYTGMMPGELLQLETQMINYETHEIVGCGMKTKKRKATPIVFPEMLAPVLAHLSELTTSKKNRIVCMNKDNFYKEYHAAMKRVGVRDLPPYSCRHTTATALALGNIAPSVIQEVMRHTKFQTTQRYIHPDTTAAKTAVETIYGSQMANK